MAASISVPGKKGFQKAPPSASIVDAQALPVAPAPSLAPDLPSADAPPVAAAEAAGLAPRVRKPFGQMGQKLAYPGRPGYHRHWFNDTRTRLMEAGEAGYTHVADPNSGRNVSRTVGIDEGGNPLVAFLMETPQEWYDQDMAAQQRDVDKVDEAIHRGNVQGQVGQDGRYIPSRGINITT